MEMYDVYNDERIPTGKILPRNERCGKGENRQVVHICIFNSNNEVLIQQRQSTKRDYANLWDLSVGGCSIAGETSKQTAHRELLEELGIDYDFTENKPYLSINFEGGFDDFYFVFMDLDISTLKLQESEVQAVKWASLEDVLKLRRENKFIAYFETFLVSLFDLKTKRGCFDI